MESLAETRTVEQVLAVITAVAQAQAIGRRYGLHCGEQVHGLTAAEFAAVVEAYGAAVKVFPPQEEHRGFRTARVVIGGAEIDCFSRDES